jgi:hypothetical protein
MMMLMPIEARQRMDVCTWKDDDDEAIVTYPPTLQ